MLWCYNLFTEQWEKYVTPDSKSAPSSAFGGCAAVIGSDVYMFGSYLIDEKKTNVCNVETNPVV